MRITAAVVTAALWLAGAAANAAVDVQGPATVIDGNTLEVQGTRMRLWGFEAPTDEWCADCGERAENALRKIVEGQRLWCTQVRISNGPAVVDETPAATCAIIKRRGGTKHPGNPDRKRNVAILYAAKGWAAAWYWRDFGGQLGAAIAEAGRKAQKRRRGMWRHELTIPDSSPYRTRNLYWIAPAELTIRGIARNVISGDRLQVDRMQIHLAGISC